MNIAFKILELSAKGSWSQTVNSFQTGGPVHAVGRKVPLPGPHLARPQRHLQTAFALPQRIFSALAFHELPQLSTDISHHFQKIVVGLLNFTAKTFHHADDFIAEFDWKANTAMQAFLCRYGRSLKIAVIGDVSNPLWLSAAPNSPR